MSQLSEFYAFDSAGLSQGQGRPPKKRSLFRKSSGPDIEDTFRELSRPLGHYDGAGYDYAVLVEEFSEVEDAEAGERMLDALKELRARLGALEADEALLILSERGYARAMIRTMAPSSWSTSC